MSIQSNINGMLGTVAGAAAAGKHLKQQKAANELAAETAAEQAKQEMQPLIDANADAAKEYAAKSAELKELNKVQKNLKGLADGTATLTEETQALIENNYPELTAVDETQRQEGIANLNKDIKAMKIAKKELKGHQDAIVQQVTERMQHIARIKAKGGIN